MPRKALLGLLLVALSLSAAPAQAALPALAVDGDRIVDASGREVLLRGAELSSKVSRRVLRSTGWNVVRVRMDLGTVAQAERLVDTLAEDGVYSILVLPDAPLGIPAILDRFAGRPHVIGFAGMPAAGKLLFNPVAVASPGLVVSPAITAPEGLQAARAAGGTGPVLVSWPAAADPARFLSAADGLRIGTIATSLGLIDPRGALVRAYVRAAPGRLEFSHYEEPTGHFATRGVAARANTARVEIFYPGAKHKGAKFRARGLSGLRAARVPGGGRMVSGVPTGRWSFQIGPELK